MCTINHQIGGVNLDIQETSNHTPPLQGIFLMIGIISFETFP